MSCQGEMKKKRVNWSWAEEKAMLNIFIEKNIHAKLDGREVRSDECYHEVSEAMAAKGYDRNATQVRIKYYALRSSFRDLKRNQGTSGAGFETITHGALLYELFGNRPAARLIHTGVDSSRYRTAVDVADETGELEAANFEQFDDPDDDLMTLADVQAEHDPEGFAQPIQPPGIETLDGVRHQSELARSTSDQPRHGAAVPSRRSAAQPAERNIQRRQEQNLPQPNNQLGQRGERNQPIDPENERNQPLAREEDEQARVLPRRERQQPALNPRNQNDQEIGNDGPPVNQQVRREARQEFENGQGVVAGDVAVEANDIAAHQAPRPRLQNAPHGVRRGAGRVQGVQDRTKGKGSYAKALSTFHEQWSRSQRELQEDMMQRHEDFMRRELEASRRWEAEQQLAHQNHTRQLIESSNTTLSSSIDKMLAAFNKQPAQPQFIPHIPYPVDYPQRQQYPYSVHVPSRNSSQNSAYPPSFTGDQISLSYAHSSSSNSSPTSNFMPSPTHSELALPTNTDPRVIGSTSTSPDRNLSFQTTHDHGSIRERSDFL